MLIFPGTASRIFNEALQQLEKERLRVDEDIVGLALPEPIDSRPGIVVSVFPRSGLPPKPPTVYPARAILRASLTGEPELRIVHQITPESTSVKPLGIMVPATGKPVTEINSLRRLYMSLLDEAAPAVAVNDRLDQALRIKLRNLYETLAIPVLRPIYERDLAPTFFAWMNNL